MQAEKHDFYKKTNKKQTELRLEQFRFCFGLAVFKFLDAERLSGGIFKQ